MNYIPDLILILVITLIIAFSMKKGFISISKSIVALILTCVFMSSMQPTVLTFLKDSAIGSGIEEKVSENISSVYEKKDFSKETKTTDQYTSEKICESLGFPEFVENSIKSTVSGLREVEKNVLDVVADSVTAMILNVLSLILLFLLVRLVVFVLVKLLEVIFELPGLKAINKTLGAILGIVNALLIVYIVCAAVSLFAPADSRIVIEETVNKTFLLKYFYENNVLMLLFV